MAVHEWLEAWFGNVNEGKVCPEKWVDGRYRAERMSARHLMLQLVRLDMEGVHEWLDAWFGDVNEGKVWPEKWADGRYRADRLPARHTKWKPWNRIR